jgi:SAM-dependent methyltransferase
MNAVALDTVNALRTELESLEWPERFERIARAKKVAPDDDVRDAIAELRGELARRALTELGPGWGSGPFKDSIQRLPKRMRGPLSRAAKDERDRRIAEVMACGGLPLDGRGESGRFGVGLDERVVEMPLALAAAALDRPGDVLDAGSALNLPLVRAIAGQPRARVTHVTLPGSKEPRLSGDGGRFVHAFGDLRTLPFRDRAFARVVCVSTLEHVAMDTTRFGAAVRPGGGADDAVAELLRVLAPGGTLFMSVPYGRAADHGWFRIFDRAGLERLLQPVAGAATALRFFYYDGGWAEGGDTPPPAAVDTPFFEDVITGVAIVTVTAH